ncbi:MAG: DUF4386 domain-containing protein [Candidatus Dormibacteria bacterium]
MQGTPDTRLVRWLGAAFVAQFIGSIAAEGLTSSILTGNISAVMVSVTHNVGQIRVDILIQLATWVSIIVMTSLLYVILRGRSRPVALVALVLWVTEVLLSAVSVLGLYALLTVSPDFVRAGAPPTSYYGTLGTLFLGLEQHAAEVSLLFFALGAFLWYGLFFTTRLVPRGLSVWALLAMVLVLAGILPQVWDHSINVPLTLDIPYLPFELVVGLWLLVRGASPAFSTA